MLSPSRYFTLSLYFSRKSACICTKPLPLPLPPFPPEALSRLLIFLVSCRARSAWASSLVACEADSSATRFSRACTCAEVSKVAGSNLCCSRNPLSSVQMTSSSMDDGIPGALAWPVKRLELPNLQDCRSQDHCSQSFIKSCNAIDTFNNMPHTIIIDWLHESRQNFIGNKTRFCFGSRAARLSQQLQEPLTSFSKFLFCTDKASTTDVSRCVQWPGAHRPHPLTSR
jgi:hypothetical protein